MTFPNDDPATIAGRFLAARRAASGLDHYPGDFPASLDQAYAVQDQAIAGWGKPVIGWKVGRITPPQSDAFGADRLTGPIFRAIVPLDGAVSELPVFADGFAAAEAEFLLRIGAAPTLGQHRFTLDEAGALIDAVHVGIEIASSPLASINALGPIAVISDFGNNNGLLIGPEIPDWRNSGFEQWRVTAQVDGVEIGTGDASTFPNGAIGAVRFLLELMAERGIALQPGQWISSGAVTGVHEVGPGQLFEASFKGHFAARCRLIAANPEQA